MVSSLFASFAFLSDITFLFAVCACAEADSSCPARGLEQKKWRARPYGKRGAGLWRIYGDEFAALTFSDAGFHGPVDDDSWDLLWTHWPSNKDLAHATLPPRASSRLVNHCRYFDAAGQKCHMARHVRAVQRALGKAESESLYHPLTYILMNDSHVESWLADLTENPEAVWLVKECSAGRSQGIELVSGQAKHASIVKSSLYTWAVAQRYIERPFLGWDGSKFHLRLYVLVASWKPARVFLYDEGLVFRSRFRYNSKSLNLARDVFSGVSDEVDNLALSSLWEALGSRSISVKEKIIEAFRTILGTAVTESFGPADNLGSRGYDCFDLYGVDVMLDESLHPWILEINPGPNMWVSEQSAVNETLIKGTFLEQVARWAHRSLQAGLDEAHKMLLNFTRVL
eukprot:TRINITY_DN8298_c0_g1_i2.p1 TRINITY_DN8298_c0_g1~~TRINITY_DN8298_c0_g1_i2.p1  ORF type:complete len:399 (-),score=59.79 TRINITY_DN8298_c0_g1_i2:101-1297(-)